MHGMLDRDLLNSRSLLGLATGGELRVAGLGV